MTNISRRKIDSEDYRAGYTQLITTIAKLNKTNAHSLLDDLLTETERIMLVKRFTALFMFQQQYSSYRVSETLNISISTAQRLYAQYVEGHYSNLLNCLGKKEKHKFLALVEDIILAQVDMRARARLAKRARRE